MVEKIQKGLSKTLTTLNLTENIHISGIERNEIQFNFGPCKIVDSKLSIGLDYMTQKSIEQMMKNQQSHSKEAEECKRCSQMI